MAQGDKDNFKIIEKQTDENNDQFLEDSSKTDAELAELKRRLKEELKEYEKMIKGKEGENLARSTNNENDDNNQNYNNVNNNNYYNNEQSNEMNEGEENVYEGYDHYCEEYGVQPVKNPVKELALGPKFLPSAHPLLYFTELMIASNALGLFIARSASTLRFRPMFCFASLPMNWE